MPKALARLSVNDPSRKARSGWREQCPPHELIEELSTIACPAQSWMPSDEWLVMQLAFRYTGARLQEIAGAQVDCLRHQGAIPIMRLKMSMLCLNSRSADCFRAVPIHPRLEGPLFDLANKQGSGRLFPNSGSVAMGRYFPNAYRYGHEFCRSYTALARLVWPPMKVHSWRCHVVRRLVENKFLPESLALQFVGGPTVSSCGLHQRRIDLKEMYEGLKMLK